MGLGYAPFEPEYDPLKDWRPKKVQSNLSDDVVSRSLTFGGPDVTECNHLIMFFVFGVFLLALVDGIRQ